MSIFKTLRQRGHEGTAVIVEALRTFYSTKELPKLLRWCVPTFGSSVRYGLQNIRGNLMFRGILHCYPAVDWHCYPRGSFELRMLLSRVCSWRANFRGRLPADDGDDDEEFNEREGVGI